MFRRKTIIEANSNLGTSTQRVPRKTKGIGITIPFNNPNGIFGISYVNKTQILSNLKNLLLTDKGERYFEPDFGTNIKSVLFENIVDEEEFKEKLRGEIQSAIGYWMPYLQITDLSINLNMGEDGRIDDPSHAVGIFLRVGINGTGIYLPIRIFISETATIRIIEEAQN